MSEEQGKMNQSGAGDINDGLRAQCESRLGLLDASFLCQSVGILNPPEPFCVSEEALLEEVMEALRDRRIGCVLIVDKAGKLSGIFSERDYILKVYGKAGAAKQPISTYMTARPVAESPEIPIAYALTMMSQGGFRHLPLIDSESVPVGIVSVKDVMDYLVSSSVDDLLSFEVEGLVD